MSDIEQNQAKWMLQECTAAVWPLILPDALSKDTKDLIVRFAQNLGVKLAKAQEKYGYKDGWKDDHWMDECRKELLSHLYKGDPIDVAAYCAFLDYHKEPTFIKENAM